jgi:hypothetical protein
MLLENAFDAIANLTPASSVFSTSDETDYACEMKPDGVR